MNIKRFLIIILILIEATTVDETVSSSISSENSFIYSSTKHKYELFNAHVNSLYANCNLENSLDYIVFKLSLIGYYNLCSRNLIGKDSILTIIDYQSPSYEKRLFVINLNTGTVEFNTLVAHGMNTGNVYATNFSNRSGSKKSSLGFYITGKPYNGKHKYSLKIHGVDTLFNSNALSRGVVFHGARYVSEDYADRHGRIGRSFGCPAIPVNDNRAIIDMIKDESCVFIYYPDENYLNYSKYLDINVAVEYCYGNREFLSYSRMNPIIPQIEHSGSLIRDF